MEKTKTNTFPGPIYVKRKGGFVIDGEVVLESNNCRQELMSWEFILAQLALGQISYDEARVGIMDEWMTGNAERQYREMGK